MNYNQNNKISQITEKTLIIGLDIGSKTHYARAFDYRGMELTKKAHKVQNTREGFEEFQLWLNDLLDKHEKEKAIIGIEPTGHYWFNIYDYMNSEDKTFVMVNPFHVKRSKELDDNNQTKSDLKDPKVIAKLVIAGRYSIPYVPDDMYSDLRILMNLRESESNQMIAIKNKLHRWIDIYFPEYKAVYSNVSAISGLMILKKLTFPKEIAEIGVEGVVKVWSDAKLRAVGYKKARELVEAAKNSIGRTISTEGPRYEIQLILDEYNVKLEVLKELEEKILKILEKIPAAKKLVAIKGINEITAAKVLSEIGDIRRFNSPKQIQKLAGLSLIENSSGKHKGMTMISKRGRSKLRKHLYLAVFTLLSKNTEFKELHEYFTKRLNNPLKKKQSMIALANKLIRIFYTLLTKDVEYDPEKMLQDIKRQDCIKIAA